MILKDRDRPFRTAAVWKPAEGNPGLFNIQPSDVPAFSRRRPGSRPAPIVTLRLAVYADRSLPCRFYQGGHGSKRFHMQRLRLAKKSIPHPSPIACAEEYGVAPMRLFAHFVFLAVRPGRQGWQRCIGRHPRNHPRDEQDRDRARGADQPLAHHRARIVRQGSDGDALFPTKCAMPPNTRSSGVPRQLADHFSSRLPNRCLAAVRAVWSKPEQEGVGPTTVQSNLHAADRPRWPPSAKPLTGIHPGQTTFATKSANIGLENRSKSIFIRSPQQAHITGHSHRSPIQLRQTPGKSVSILASATVTCRSAR